jgi:TatD DNase family protein
MFFNVHTHQTIANESEIAIQNLFVHHTQALHEGYYSASLHPWFLKEIDTVQAISISMELAENEQILAIGEAGLDRLVDFPFEKQLQIFKSQIALAESVQKPLIIHCVRAYSEILALRKSIRPTQTWILHGFTGNAQIAQDCMCHGCYLSFGHWLFNANSKIPTLFTELPLEAVFLETDDSNLTIQQIYNQAALLKNISLKALETQISANFVRVFGNYQIKNQKI